MLTVVGSTELSSASGDDSTPSETGKSRILIHVLYASILDSFRQFLLDLGGNLSVTDSLALELSREEYTRLAVWGVQNRASSLPDTHGSLAGVLAEQPELRELVTDILKETHTCLLQVLPAASTCDATSLEISNESDSESDISTSSDGDAEPPLERLATHLKRVFGNIDELYQLQSLLRKPRLNGRYLHSSISYDNLPGYQQDYQHIRQKFDCWAKDCIAQSSEEEAGESVTSRQNRTEPDNQPGISINDILLRQQAEDNSLQVKDVLSRRLAAANSKRRKQLRYWETHPYREVGDDDRLLLDAKTPVQSDLDAAKRVNPGDFDNNAPKSVKAPTTVHTFSTAPRSAIFPTATRHANVEVARTIYEPSLIGKSPRNTIRVPDVPLVAEGERTLTCPYCYMTLDVKAMENRDNWK